MHGPTKKPGPSKDRNLEAGTQQGYRIAVKVTLWCPVVDVEEYKLPNGVQCNWCRDAQLSATFEL